MVELQWTVRESYSYSLLLLSLMFFCRQLAVLGAGLMGAGVAQVSVQRGLPTILRDISLDGVARGQGQIQTNLSKLVKRKKLTSVEREQVWCVCARLCMQ